MREPAAKTLLEHADFLRALARSILRDEHAAEDVVQEAILAAGGRPGLRGWLGAVARNLAVSRMRADRRRARREQAAARPEAHGDVPEAVARLEAQQRVVEAVLALEPPYRAVVLERFFYDRPMPEVAERLGVPVATARTRLRRALATLKARLERRMGPAAMIAALSLLARPAGAATVTGVLLMSTKIKVAAVLMLVATTGWLVHASRGSPDTSRDGSFVGVGATDAPVSRGGAVNDTSAVATSKEGVASPPETSLDAGDTRLEPALVLRGIVLTPAGQPAPGAAVVVRQNREEPLRTVSDEAGRFSIPVPDALTAPGPISQETQLLVAAHRAGFVEGQEPVTDANAELRIVLGRARTVRGIVMDAVTGKGVAGAELAVPVSVPSLAGRWQVGKTEVDGTFEVAVHPLPGRLSRSVPGLIASATGYTPCHVRAHDLRDDGNRILLEPSTTVRGRVVHADGRGASGIPVVSYRAHVPASDPPSSPEVARLAEAKLRALEAQGHGPPKLEVDWPPCTSTVSGASGDFTVEVSRTSPFRIEAEAWPLAGNVEMFSAPDEAVIVAIAPQWGFRLLRVRVLDAARRPLAGASVWQANLGAAMNPTGSGPAGQPAFRTGEDGYADIWPGGGKEGALFVAWTKDWVGVSTAPVDLLASDPCTPEIVCEPAGSVRGRVVDTPLHHGARASLWWPVGEVPWRMQYVRLGRDGRFILPGAPAGRCTVVVADPGGRSFLRELHLGAGEARDLGDVALDPPAVLQGVVRMAEGEAGADAMLSWQPVAPYERRVFVDMYWERVRADASGAFSIPVWSRGAVRVWVQGGPFTVVEEGHPLAGRKIPFGKTIDVECRPGDGPLTIVLPPGR